MSQASADQVFGRDYQASTRDNGLSPPACNFPKGEFMTDQANRMARAAALLARAQMCRRAASIPTTGGHSSDRILLDLAEQLERDAAALAPRGRPSPT